MERVAGKKEKSPSRRKDKSPQPKNQTEIGQLTKQAHEIAAESIRRAIGELAKQIADDCSTQAHP